MLYKSNLYIWQIKLDIIVTLFHDPSLGPYAWAIFTQQACCHSQSRPAPQVQLALSRVWGLETSQYRSWPSPFNQVGVLGQSGQGPVHVHSRLAAALHLPVLSFRCPLVVTASGFQCREEAS